MTFDAAPGYLSADDCRLADLIDLVSQKTDLADYPYASTVGQNVLIYDGARLRKQLSRPACRPRVENELARALLDGPGIVVLTGAFDDPWVIDRATWQFEAIIAAQRAAGGAAGDHFAAAGQNDRIWNALEKLALRAPEVFADYYANDLIATVCRAWLGPGYQVTSQVNVVNPGGSAQDMHRDYHLGFASGEQAARFPAHAHRLSGVLTLQGAVAHTDMPAETGPTMYLPHSQKYLPGYLAWRMPEFGAYFEANYVQLPLGKGDAVFFNPALFHAAGANRTADVRRMANLLQVSSAFGRAMEAVDRAAMSAAVSPALQGMADDGASPAAIANVIAACAEGYPFPTNLDLDQPVDGLAPRTQADILGRAVSEQWSRQQLETELGTWSARRQTRRFTYSTKEIRS
jgi:ectoine hydroxylase-related dioxygenase (phytanoyl-CoA dioxygenase family)